jgi:hypothetical protein
LLFDWFDGLLLQQEHGNNTGLRAAKRTGLNFTSKRILRLSIHFYDVVFVSRPFPAAHVLCGRDLTA